MEKIVCFDIGGTKIAKSVVETDGQRYTFLETVIINNPRNSKEIEEIILEYCKEADKIYQIKKIAISASKIIDQEKKKAVQAKDVYGADEFSFGFLEKSNYEVKLENDGRCFALGEKFFGQAKGKDCILAITLGTDIGGGFLSNGQNYRGEHNSSLEISHINFLCHERVEKWKDLSGGQAIQRKYLAKTGKSKTAEEIFSLATEGEKEATEIIEKAEYYLGIGLANLVTILDPGIIIVGGGICDQKKYIENIFKIAQENTFNKKADYLWRISQLKERANLLGAASLYFFD
jgi:glucokinase